MTCLVKTLIWYKYDEKNEKKRGTEVPLFNYYIVKKL
jgi:hypothetical protein